MEAVIDFQKYKKLTEKSYYKKMGKVLNVVGLTIESAGPDAKLGDLCKINLEPDEDEEIKSILAEVVGFKEGKTLLMPYEPVDGIGLGCIVENMGYPLSVQVDRKSTRLNSSHL